jgi:Domain of unknown function (DUF5753)/Helix-turn-helix domain
MPAYKPGSAAQPNPSVNDPRIGNELRRFREARQLMGDNVAHALKWSPSKISRYERGRTGVSRRGLEQILAYYQQQHAMPQGQATAIIAMFDQALEMARFLHPFLGPAVMACFVREWSTRYVPRLLQTHDYAMAVLRDLQAATGMAPGEIRDAAAGIAKWQARLAESPPVRVHALLDESVLYRMAGSADVMRAQLAHLEKAAAAEGTDIEVRVLPFTATRIPRWTGAFSYLEYATVAGADESAEVVTEETDGPCQPYLTERGLWHRYQLFSELWKAADEPDTAVKRALSAAWA